MQLQPWPGRLHHGHGHVTSPYHVHVQKVSCTDLLSSLTCTNVVLWRITPLFAEWLAHPSNLLSRSGLLDNTSHVLELGCGISGLIGLALAGSGRVAKYVNTDQPYVLGLVRENVENNYAAFVSGRKGRGAAARKGNVKSKAKEKPKSDAVTGDDIITHELDWETSDVSTLYNDLGVSHLDLLISCDCIYNESLIEPLATTMREICLLAPNVTKPTIVVVAQQLRSPDVMEAWLKSFCKWFRVWRVPENELNLADLQGGLGEGRGYVVHIGVLK